MMPSRPRTRAPATPMPSRAVRPLPSPFGWEYKGLNKHDLSTCQMLTRAPCLISCLVAFFTVYGVLLAAFWYAFLVLNIFLSVVFMWQNLDLYWHIWTPICFLVPLVFPIVAIACGSIGHQFGTRCVDTCQPVNLPFSR